MVHPTIDTPGEREKLNRRWNHFKVLVKRFEATLTELPDAERDEREKQWRRRFGDALSDIANWYPRAQYNPAFLH